ncbi:ImmA/IrrE family metallo-endopeptidase [Janthinobacterium sp. SUN098]|uniref:ImmA/IrrE family metallo-endopeptidase n=1 Tax=Janthinobacterium sp. SUN098 TaxID=3002437 RepID=UPI0038D3D61D
MNIDPERFSPAERLLWGYGVIDPSHINLEGIAHDQNAQVIYRPLGGCEARLVVFGDKAVISVNNGSPEGRQRFSLAHELAHWICDRHAGSFMCAQEDIGPQNAEARTMEAEANGFASQLILPSYLVDPWVAGKMVSLEVAATLAHEFRTSLTASAIKLVKRASEPAALACHDQKKLLWHQRSASFPYDFYLVKQLHQETEGFTMAFSGKGSMSKVKKEPANRWINGPNTYRLEVQSQSIRLPDGAILTSLNLVKETGKRRY